MTREEIEQELASELEKMERESLNCTEAARSHRINYPLVITYLGLLAFWVVVIWLILR